MSSAGVAAGDDFYKMRPAAATAFPQFCQQKVLGANAAKKERNRHAPQYSILFLPRYRKNHEPISRISSFAISDFLVYYEYEGNVPGEMFETGRPTSCFHPFFRMGECIMKTNKKLGMLSAAVLLALVSEISPQGGC